MGRIRNWTVAVLTAGLLASCATPPPPPPPPPPAPKAELPYKWTQGNAPKAYEDSVATFGRVALAPGDFRWAAAIPETGDTSIVIDLLTQLFYVYRGEQLVGVVDHLERQEGPGNAARLLGGDDQESQGLQPQI